MKRILFYIVIWLIPAMALADVNHLPKRTIENVADGVIVTYQFDNPIIRPNPLAPGSFLWQYAGFGLNDIPGEPAIPYRSDLFYIPQGYNTRIDIIETIYNDTSLILSPAVPSCVKDETIMSIDRIKPYYGLFPNQVIAYDPLDDFRGVGLQRITVMPVQYNCEHHIARFYSKISYRITFIPNSNNLCNRNNIHKIRDFLSNVTLNYESLPLIQRESLNTETNSTNYLIITVNNYLDTLQQFIKWKRIKGNRVFLESRNRGDWTTDSIKQIIDSINSIYQLDFVLMVGGFDDVPADSILTYGLGNFYYFVTDYEYGLPTTNLNIAQIARGRIPINSPQELSIVLNKIINYERRPIRDRDFYRKALHCGEFSDYDRNKEEDMCFILTNENIREHLIHNYNVQVHQSYYFFDLVGPPATTDILHWDNTLWGNGDALPDSLQPSVFNWNLNQVSSTINEGALYVLYNGHGSKSGWQAPSFVSSNVDALQNGDKQPIVFSLACETGKYNEEGDCFAERMLKKGNGGCVGIFAATEKTLSGFDDTMAYGMFDAIWPNLQLVHAFKKYGGDLYQYTPILNPVYEMGRILDLGLLRMAETFGKNNPYDRRNLTEELYHYFGDPSMMIYTETPRDFIEPTIKYVNGKIFVQSPCDSTRITFYTPDVTNPVIDSFIDESVEYETNADSVIICLDKHNYVPFITTFYRNLYIQNETINDNRYYIGDNILIGNHVTTEKPIGDVRIENANISIEGKSVKLYSGTRIIQSDVRINAK